MFLREYLRMEGDDIAWAFIHEGIKSVSGMTIILMQVGSHWFAIACFSSGRWPSMNAGVTSVSSMPIVLVQVGCRARRWFAAACFWFAKDKTRAVCQWVCNTA